MIRAFRLVAVLVLGAISASCAAPGSSSFNSKPDDVYSVIPSMADVRNLMGDSNWWAGPPSFQVLPLNAATAAATEKYSVSEEFLHLGTDERLRVRYTVFDKTSSATSVMSAYSTAYGTSPSSPKVGDQVLYYAFSGSGGAPFVTRTFVRVGQVVVQIAWSRKDGVPTVKQLGKNATKFSDGLKTLSKVHASPHPVDPRQLPPPGLDITLLGATKMPIESFVVMTLIAVPDPILSLYHQSGINDFAYGDYALNNDTHMEVQTGLLTFPSAADAASWAGAFAPGKPDSNGIAGAYVSIAGSPAAGVYHYLFTSGEFGGYLVCKSSVDGEAASKECEEPTVRTALAWKLALGGLG